MSNTTPISQGFYGLGIAPKLLDILYANKYNTPTPIQAKSIPIAIEGQDLIGVAQTGTGKTLAFTIPMIQRLAQVKGRALVVLPTRELAIQADEVIRQIGRGIGLRTAVLIGGASMHLQQKMLRDKPHVIVATPGRLIDHLEQRTIKLDDVHILVLDEADRMLDMGFLPQITKILTALPKDRQSMLFSATMPESILKIVAKHMKLPVHVEIARQGTTAEKVSQELYIIQKDAKARLLDKILSERRGSVLVFSRTKHGAKKIARQVRDMGHTASEIHANRSLAQRREALDGFKSGKYRVMVATDIAARGIDVKNIELVVNYDLPDNPEDYVHRIGRTGRACESGHAVSFATPDQRSDIRDIERLIRKPLPVAHVTELPAARPASKFEDRDDAPRYGGGRSFGGRSNGRPGGQRPSFGGGRPFGGSRPQSNRGMGGYARPQGGDRPIARPAFSSDRRGYTQGDRRQNDSRPSQGRRPGSSGRPGGASAGPARTVKVTW